VLKSVYFYRKNAGNMKKICILNGALYYIYTNIIISVPVLNMDKRSTMPAHGSIQHAPMVGKQAEVEVTSILSSLKKGAHS